MRSAAYFIRNLPAWIGWAKYLSFTTYTFQAFLNISSRQQIQGCVQRRRRGLPRGRNVRHGGGLEESLPAEHERVLWHALPDVPSLPDPRVRGAEVGCHQEQEVKMHLHHRERMDAPDGRGASDPCQDVCAIFLPASKHARTRPVIPLARLAKVDLGPGCRVLMYMR